MEDLLRTPQGDRCATNQVLREAPLPPYGNQVMQASVAHPLHLLIGLCGL
jgi:hypothetical protein